MSKSFPTPDDLKKKQVVADVEAEGRNLTPLQKNLLEIKLKDPAKPDIVAVREAGYSVTNNAKASTIMKRLEGKLGAHFEQAGITPNKLAKLFYKCLNAEKVAAIKVRVYDKNGDPLTEVIKTVTLGPDYGIMLSALKFICKVSNIEVPININVNQNHEHNLSLGEDTIRRLEERERAANSFDIPSEVVSV